MIDIREGAILSGVCCAGYDWEVVLINGPEIGTVWGMCKNPDCPEYQENLGPQDHYRGVKQIMLDGMSFRTKDNLRYAEVVCAQTGSHPHPSPLPQGEGTGGIDDGAFCGVE